MKYLIGLVCLVMAVPLTSQRLIVKDVNLVDVENRKVVPERSVAIVNGKILDINSFRRLKATDQDSIIEGTGKFLIPGLVDAHIHFFQSGGLYTRPDAIDLRDWFSYSDEIQFAKDNASDYLQRYLRLGITTVMDVGGPMWNFTVRDSIATSMMSPNVLVTGPLFSIVDRVKLDEGDPPIVKVTSKEDIDQLFDQMLDRKPDFIKIWYIASQQYPAEESYPLVAYVGQRCRENNLRLAVHATQHKTAELAVKAGANILVHSVDDEIISDDFLQTLKTNNVTYIPTLVVSKGYGRTFTGKLPHDAQDLTWANPKAYGTLTDLKRAEPSTLPGFLKNFYGQDLPPFYDVKDSIMFENLQKLVAAGVNVATGTDAGNIGTMHASSYFQELQAMQQAGMTGWEIIEASTINPAKGFGMGDTHGSVAVGKVADLVLLNGNPAEDISAFSSIEAVFKDGQPMAPTTILSESPEQIVQRQLNAYNARDIDAFMATYSENIQIFNLDANILYDGKEAMRARYSKLFEDTPNLYCELKNRMVMGNTVIDQERVQYNDQIIRAIAIYEVTDGLISKVNFIRP